MSSARVRIFSKTLCWYCRAAEALLRERGIEFERIDVAGDAATRAWLREVTGQRTVPQIFVNEKPIGGYRELSALANSGALTSLLE